MENKCNFTPTEMEILDKLVDKYRPIIDCKITKRAFCEKKDKAWENLTREYNANPGIIVRTVAQLRNKYKNLKAQKKSNDSRAYILATDENGKNASAAASDVERSRVEVTQAPEGSNNGNECYEPAVELVEDASNDGNIDTECATTCKSAVITETFPETNVKISDQDTVAVNSSTLKNKEPKSTTLPSYKRKLNIAADIEAEIAKARKSALEEENKLFLEFKRTEHLALMVSLKKDDEYKKLQHEMMVQEHKAKIQLLSAKAEHYKLLNAQLKQSMKTCK